MLCTANEYIAIPEIEDDGSIISFNCLYMAYRGMIEFRGEPVIRIGASCNGKKIELCHSSSLHHWIHTFVGGEGGVEARMTLVAPVGKKGFFYRLEFSNKGKDEAFLSIDAMTNVERVVHTVNESKDYDGRCHTYISSWDGAPVFDIRSGFPVLALSTSSDSTVSWNISERGFSGLKELLLPPGQEEAVTFFWGLGYEDISAVTAVRDLIRINGECLQKETEKYLSGIVKGDKDCNFYETLNVNMIFSLFYSTGMTIDTEEFVSVTSRSPRYYVSAAYWDRDSLLWSLPAIATADKKKARMLMEYAYTVQMKNVGIHSRYIDGTVLEPGFELDELCAPVIALENYMSITGDTSIVEKSYIVEGLEKILSIIREKKGACGLYETFLQPTDDYAPKKYLTYDNILLERALSILQKYLDPGLSGDIAELEEKIEEQCIKTVDGRREYVWAIDGDGGYDIYDEPPGSLLLIPVYATHYDEEAYRNTVSRILDPSYRLSFALSPFGAIGCDHAPHPWVLSLANKILVFHDRKDVEKLTKAPMDHKIVSESIDEDTGVSVTGNAFATAAGFVAYVLSRENVE
ncbi:MAG: glycoside hydrolase family 125 protein [Candidatus Ornithospirochaeta sp.]